ncbi:type I-E CRISPR-associated protein Cas5/CasD [Pseudoalteromonas luteoviolacea]|uniref:Type I-E CRISPR-associated protein Cas5/CasD n=1 Tax=Pseudoalteromonas luteoviolacea TaxID=43657 RepID=A0A1C0TR36_9GAMM|nr:type I-E CRISPR-associated protein Cas5/CasD [Pseudoalteromonas luteoviolacea]MBQ4811675.1 type I-E CRISPR-associated protein Cas5/CasD [Pseudoalteromonas luteoviolacea]OCQ21418.1 type I-E CRISPR-associated protein Cas5/CasD [Pseudoalteromonas luteoviolacea]
MSTLLIRLAGPMQSWGLKSAFELRNTQLDPTKSGVIGLLCASLGRERNESLEDLTSLRMGVRIDKPGDLAFDYQTALNVAKADGGKPDTQLSHRAYLADAAFWVGFEGDKPLLEQLYDALLNPVWPQFLGRKSYLPGVPLVDPRNALVDVSLEVALQQAPRMIAEHETLADVPVKYVYDSEHKAGTEQRHDVPLSFELNHRAFTFRCVKSSWGRVDTEEVLYV